MNREPTSDAAVRPPCFGKVPLLFKRPCVGCAAHAACLAAFCPVGVSLSATNRTVCTVSQQPPPVRQGATAYDLAAYAAIRRVAKSHGLRAVVRPSGKTAFKRGKAVVFSIVRADTDMVVLAIRDRKGVRDAASAVGCTLYRHGGGARWRLTHDGGDLGGMQKRLRPLLLADLARRG